MHRRYREAGTTTATIRHCHLKGVPAYASRRSDTVWTELDFQALAHNGVLNTPGFTCVDVHKRCNQYNRPTVYCIVSNQVSAAPSQTSKDVVIHPSLDDDTAASPPKKTLWETIRTGFTFDHSLSLDRHCSRISWRVGKVST
jgi:hypothetical protein